MLPEMSENELFRRSLDSIKERSSFINHEEIYPPQISLHEVQLLMLKKEMKLQES